MSAPTGSPPFSLMRQDLDQLQLLSAGAPLPPLSCGHAPSHLDAIKARVDEFVRRFIDSGDLGRCFDLGRVPAGRRVWLVIRSGTIDLCATDSASPLQCAYLKPDGSPERSVSGTASTTPLTAQEKPALTESARVLQDIQRIYTECMTPTAAPSGPATAAPIPSSGAAVPTATATPPALTPTPLGGVAVPATTSTPPTSEAHLQSMERLLRDTIGALVHTQQAQAREHMLLMEHSTREHAETLAALERAALRAEQHMQLLQHHADLSLQQLRTAHDAEVARLTAADQQTADALRTALATATQTHALLASQLDAQRAAERASQETLRTMTDAAASRLETAHREALTTATQTHALLASQLDAQRAAERTSQEAFRTMTDAAASGLETAHREALTAATQTHTLLASQLDAQRAAERTSQEAFRTMTDAAASRLETAHREALAAQEREFSTSLHEAHASFQETIRSLRESQSQAERAHDRITAAMQQRIDSLEAHLRALSTQVQNPDILLSMIAPLREEIAQTRQLFLEILSQLLRASSLEARGREEGRLREENAHLLEELREAHNRMREMEGLFSQGQREWNRAAEELQAQVECLTRARATNEEERERLRAVLGQLRRELDTQTERTQTTERTLSTQNHDIAALKAALERITQEREDLQAKLARACSEMAHLQQTIDTLTREKQDAETRVATLQTQLSEQQSSAEGTQARLAAATTEIDSLRRELQEKEAEIRRQREAATTQATALEGLEAQASRLQAQLSEGQQANADLTRRLETATRSSGEQQARLEAEKARFQQAQEEFQRRIDALTREKQTAAAQVTTLEAQLAEQRSSAEGTQARLAAATTTIDSLRNELRDKEAEILRQSEAATTQADTLRELEAQASHLRDQLSEGERAKADLTRRLETATRSSGEQQTLLETEKARFQQAQEEFQRRIDTLTREKQDAATLVTTLEARLAEQRSSADGIQTQLTAATREIDSLRRELQLKDAEILRQSGAATTQTAALEELGTRASHLRDLLAQKEAALASTQGELQETREAALQIQRDLEEKTRAMEALQAELSTLRDDNIFLFDLATEAERQAERLGLELVEMEARAAILNDYIQLLNSQPNTDTAALARSKEALAALEEEIATLRRQLLQDPRSFEDKGTQAPPPAAAAPVDLRLKLARPSPGAAETSPRPKPEAISPRTPRRPAPPPSDLQPEIFRTAADFLQSDEGRTVLGKVILKARRDPSWVSCWTEIKELLDCYLQPSSAAATVPPSPLVHRPLSALDVALLGKRQQEDKLVAKSEATRKDPSPEQKTFHRHMTTLGWHAEELHRPNCQEVTLSWALPTKVANEHTPAAIITHCGGRIEPLQKAYTTFQTLFREALPAGASDQQKAAATERVERAFTTVMEPGITQYIRDLLYRHYWLMCLYRDRPLFPSLPYDALSPEQKAQVGSTPDDIRLYNELLASTACLVALAPIATQLAEELQKAQANLAPFGRTSSRFSRSHSTAPRRIDPLARTLSPSQAEVKPRR